MSLLKRKIGILKHVKVKVEKEIIPSDERKSIRCEYCEEWLEDKCRHINWCIKFNHPSSQYLPRKYAYVIYKRKIIHNYMIIYQNSSLLLK